MNGTYQMCLVSSVGVSAWSDEVILGFAKQEDAFHTFFNEPHEIERGMNTY
jgi:hypothetical protein